MADFCMMFNRGVDISVCSGLVFGPSRFPVSFAFPNVCKWAWKESYSKWLAGHAHFSGIFTFFPRQKLYKRKSALPKGLRIASCSPGGWRKIIIYLLEFCKPWKKSTILWRRPQKAIENLECRFIFSVPLNSFCLYVSMTAWLHFNWMYILTFNLLHSPCFIEYITGMNSSWSHTKFTSLYN